MKKIIIVILAIIAMAFFTAADYFTNEARWYGMRQTGNRSDVGAVLLTETNITSSIVLQVDEQSSNPVNINISNYGFKEYVSSVLNNETHKSAIVFNSRLEHLILTPNDTSATYRFKLTQDSDGTIIYDQTGLDFTGRTGIIVNVPLIGYINVTIQNASKSINTSIKIVYT